MKKQAKIELLLVLTEIYKLFLILSLSIHSWFSMQDVRCWYPSAVIGEEARYNLEGRHPIINFIVIFSVDCLKYNMPKWKNNNKTLSHSLLFSFRWYLTSNLCIEASAAFNFTLTYERYFCFYVFHTHHSLRV